MRVLWVSLVEFPPLSVALGKTPPAHCGWLYSSAWALLQAMPELELAVLVYSYGKRYEKIDAEGISYYLIPSSRMDKATKAQVVACRETIADFHPDIIHIHGTEHSLAAAVCRANTNKIKMVANIQGLAGPYMQYADGGLSIWDKIGNITPLDFYRGTFMLNAKRSFKRRAECENYVLTHISDIIGRTQWDHDHVITVNPSLYYHFMNETLRDSFYEEPKWSIDKCKRHSIFVSNCGSPLKGAHQVLKAMPIILQQYPDAIVNFCGGQRANGGWKENMHMQGYHLYLRRLVKKLHLEEHVRFLGQLSEHEMKQAFLDANVYVMPSAIENSPNSLCEAQILGVPAVASYCGGTPSLLTDGETGFLYRYEEYVMLAQTVIRLFGETDFTALSKNERTAASARHDRVVNAGRLSEIYKELLNTR